MFGLEKPSNNFSFYFLVLPLSKPFLLIQAYMVSSHGLLVTAGALSVSSLSYPSYKLVVLYAFLFMSCLKIDGPEVIQIISGYRLAFSSTEYTGTVYQAKVFPKIKMLHNLSCLETRFRLLCRYQFIEQQPFKPRFQTA